MYQFITCFLKCIFCQESFDVLMGGRIVLGGGVVLFLARIMCYFLLEQCVSLKYQGVFEIEDFKMVAQTTCVKLRFKQNNRLKIISKYESEFFIVNMRIFLKQLFSFNKYQSTDQELIGTKNVRMVQGTCTCIQLCSSGVNGRYNINSRRNILFQTKRLIPRKQRIRFIERIIPSIWISFFVLIQFYMGSHKNRIISNISENIVKYRPISIQIKNKHQTVRDVSETSHQGVLKNSNFGSG
eukprot:TRINITY_DN10676_c0_g2_i1.p2 TRINITY_DN10676_c0_g2~~TRINITY_DN10676_c0_g2_i1.p2  ORF type:complete len:240 (-),score=-17.33 TRINITY_DN10676_c0_g2_i1:1376-2095(-)